MVVKLVGDSVELAANASDSIILEFERAYSVRKFRFKSTGRVNVTRIEHVGVHEVLTGTVELDSLITRGQEWELPEEIAVDRGHKIVWSLKDISGATNRVNIAAECVG